MANGDAKRSHVRIAAAILGALLVAATVFTYLSYTARFTSVDTVTVTAPCESVEGSVRASRARTTKARCRISFSRGTKDSGLSSFVG